MVRQENNPACACLCPPFFENFRVYAPNRSAVTVDVAYLSSLQMEIVLYFTRHLYFLFIVKICKNKI